VQESLQDANAPKELRQVIDTMSTEPESRKALRNARRILIKAGTSVVANDDGRPSLTRLGAICEQIAEVSTMLSLSLLVDTHSEMGTRCNRSSSPSARDRRRYTGGGSR
jgi:hypothetical protein